jgi:hypothetical protein
MWAGWDRGPGAGDRGPATGGVVMALVGTGQGGAGCGGRRIRGNDPKGLSRPIAKSFWEWLAMSDGDCPLDGPVMECLQLPGKSQRGR